MKRTGQNSQFSQQELQRNQSERERERQNKERSCMSYEQIKKENKKTQA